MTSQIEDEDDILIYQQLQELHVQRLQESRYELGRVVWESRCSGATVSCSLWCHCSGGQLASHPPTEPSHSKPARRKKKKQPGNGLSFQFNHITFSDLWPVPALTRHCSIELSAMMYRVFPMWKPPVTWNVERVAEGVNFTFHLILI